MRLVPLILAAAMSATALAAAPVDDPAAKPRLHNSAMAFDEFWEANKGKPAAEQLAAFKSRVSPEFPIFYDVARFKGSLTQAQHDARIEDAIKEFAAIRTRYVSKAQQFGAELPGYVASFRARFPDFAPPDDIYVVHSLGEMDGGVRTVDGKSFLIFGVDGMVKYHGGGNESAFFHHELFHTYHYAAMDGCHGEAIWESLWTEGLATYVSHVMNPQANEQELLLDMPDHMAARTRAMLPESLSQLENVLDEDDRQTYVGMFTMRGDAGTLPKRRGYYLGYLVAREAGRTHDIRELAKLQCGQVKELVHATVHKLRVEAQPKAL